MQSLARSIRSINPVIRRVLAHRWFWRIAVLVFVVQALYIAVVGRYSMAFDEYYHLGLIQEYSKVWFPWLIQQPPGPAEIGAITTDGSYLYHYLMSFVYRLIELVTTHTTAQLIIMRSLDVGIFTIGLYCFRRLFVRLGLSTAISQLILVVLMYIPISAWLAGQLTYDVLWFTLTAYTVYKLVELVQSVEKTKRLPLSQLAIVLSLLLLGAQVKYASLPFVLAGVVFLLGWLGNLVRLKKLSIPKIGRAWRTEIGRAATIASIVLFVSASGLFLARYGVNIMKYHNPVPSCGVVLTPERCSAYGPYGRNLGYQERKLNELLSVSDKATYPIKWFTQMVWETYFTVGPREVGYKARDPIPTAYVAGYIMIIATTIIVIVGGRRIWRFGSVHRLLLVLAGTYIFFLFFTNIRGYFTTGVPVAIHGRYVLALMPLLGFLSYAVLRSYGWWRYVRAYGWVAAAVLGILTVYGGGIAVYAIRADMDWYWTWAEPVAHAVQTVLRAVVIH